MGLRHAQAGDLSYHQREGAALDVFWNEPSIGPGFAALDNVMLQPHRSSATVETRTAMVGLVQKNLRALFNDEPLLTEYTLHVPNRSAVAHITTLRHSHP